MKKTILLVLPLLICASAAMAAKKSSLERELERELQAEEQKQAKEQRSKDIKKSVPYKKLLISATGGFGISFPSGDINASGGQEMLAAMGYTAGLSICYRFFDLGGPVIGAEYAGKQISTERSYMGSKWASLITATTVNLTLGWRFILIKMLYIEPGLYYGFRVDRWKEEIEYRSNTYEQNVTKDWTRDDAGVYLGIGVMFDVTSFMSVDIGLRMEASYLYSYVHDDKLRTNLGLLTVGVTFKVL